ncbi:hypothetical protein L596_019450 [Steinernema carpocapsae]|uniref:7TM GPCR serpentine receptor class x (Srx) domain-containing protein n=1 Tax=Steinernema carpocapsae TaxID=34508 RepID=A0A4U5MQK1_STECR|nr:hypothetical protein L596_019450 [Steinernema carpocapsae]
MNMWLPFHNIGVSIILIILYTVMLVKFYLKSQYGVSMSCKTQKSIFCQAFIICVVCAMASFVYSYMQFFPVSRWLITTGHISWQASNAGPAFVYLIFNKSLRRSVRRMLGSKKTNGTEVTIIVGR